MGDYGQRLRFGLYLDPEAAADPMATAQRADRLGLDLLGIADHPYESRFVDAHALMATVLAANRRIRVFPAVACLPLRPPAALAKAMASLDVPSGGRVELGLGAGTVWDGVRAFGGRPLPADDARAALEEAVLVVRAMWDGGTVHFRGKHYQVEGARPGPPPVHRISVWLGVTGPRSLALTGRIADGWIALSSQVPPARLLDAQRRIDEAALEAGRDPADIRRIYVLNGAIDGGAARRAVPPRGLLHGDPVRWTDEIAELAVGYGVDSFLYGGDPADLDAFALEIVPEVREIVTRERARL